MFGIVMYQDCRNRFLVCQTASFLSSAVTGCEDRHSPTGTARILSLFHFFAKKNAQTFAGTKRRRIFAVPNEKGILKTFKFFLSG
jgi:hypothetical protein